MRFFTKTVKVKVNDQKVDPRSQKFVDTITSILEDHGIADDTKRKQCAFYLFNATKKFYKGIANTLEMDGNKLQRMAEEMKKSLSKFGITGEEDQEEIILEYFTKLNELGMK